MARAQRAVLRLAVAHLETRSRSRRSGLRDDPSCARYMPVEITGLSSTKTSVCFSSCASTLPRLRKRVFRLITRSSRSEIDRRVRDLAEILPEIMRQRPVAVREHRERRVVAHRAHRLPCRPRPSDEGSVRDPRSCMPAAIWRRRSVVLAEQARLGARPDDRLELDDLLRPFLDRDIRPRAGP